MSQAETLSLIQKLMAKTERLEAQVKALGKAQKRARYLPERIRRHPLTSLGCALSLGFLLASLLQATERRREKP